MTLLTKFLMRWAVMFVVFCAGLAVLFLGIQHPWFGVTVLLVLGSLTATLFTLADPHEGYRR